MNAVKPFDGMGCNVEQAVAVLRKRITEQRETSVQRYMNNKWLQTHEQIVSRWFHERENEFRVCQ